ncbi:glycosyl hydrolase family 18 protein [Shewanella surugensis]|uniref:Glycosyl hydrolase family 18 protein n=1 Tax=Shewanella surugensis TaxID=212020 RepID=A0ABT0LJF2_9GAMM|nr:glycosyl hydrolase family 18 protein [Shewanella surugensis]
MVNLVQEANTRNYDGWDLNFEASPTQNGRVEFVEKLASELKAHGKKLSVTLKAVEAANEKYELFDIASLANLDDIYRFKIMGFDNNFAVGANIPNAIAATNWIEKVLDYMIYSQGLPANKIQLGLHNFSRMWKSLGNGKYQIDNINFRSYDFIAAQSLSSVLQWEEYGLNEFGQTVPSEEEWVDLTYKNFPYRAYVGGAKTVEKRLHFLQDYHLAGLTFWVLDNQEDPAIYDKITDYFNSYAN